MENIIDPSLENLDPTPDIITLFRKFNWRFFWDRLNMVQVSWSGKQMTSCAGVCSFHPRSGECIIRLSAPLLSLRPRKDLVETLLHEMIHAFLFITKNNRDRDGHGPEFLKHMNRINKEAGTSISVYHDFHDEVSLYAKHVWRCNGICNKMGPYYGFVRRAINSAPGPRDRWWPRHQAKCNGQFVKISEPEGYGSKCKKKKEAVQTKTGNSRDIRNMFTPIQKPTNGIIHTLGDYTEGDCCNSPGGIHKIKGSATFVTPQNKPHKAAPLSSQTNSKVNDHVRNIWANKYPESSPSSSLKRKSDNISEGSTKKIAGNNALFVEMGDRNEILNSTIFPCPFCCEPVENSRLGDHLNICLGSNIIEDSFCFDEIEIIGEKFNNCTQTVACPICSDSIPENIINRHIDECLNVKAIQDGTIVT